MPEFRADPAHVRVPATSANLGPGFDTLGLALDLRDDIVARVVASGLRIDVTGEGFSLPRDESHLVLRAMRAGFDRLGGQPAGLELDCTNRIPHSRGLGSSAAAIVAGIVLARALVLNGEALLPDAAVLALATDLEGHPDNVAATLYGGLTVAWLESGGARAVRRDCDSRVRPIVFIPPFQASTELARGLLPATVPHADAAFSAGRAALLVVALTAVPELLGPATEDRLHQRYRVSAMPHSAALVEQLRASGHAAVISGAGPTVLALAQDEHEVEQLRASTPEGWRAMPLAIDTVGAHVVGKPG